MMLQQIFRGIHVNFALRNVDRKALLGELRKKTGFSFNNCKKALDENGNDLAKAKQWLLENAQKEGWAKAEKLGHRKVEQGLIAMATQQNHGVLVEINCETDFVARNQKFHELAEKAAAIVLDHGRTLKNDTPISNILLSAENIKALKAEDGKALADHVAMMIGVIGENINIKRALCMNVSEGIKLFGSTHPAPVNPGPISFGKYAAFVALQSEKDCEEVGKQLCQHIIGMKPLRIRNSKTDAPSSNSEEESTLLLQEFLLDPNLSVQEFLQQENVEILDFVRYEVGEQTEQNDEKEAAEVCG